MSLSGQLQTIIRAVREDAAVRWALVAGAGGGAALVGLVVLLTQPEPTAPRPPSLADQKPPVPRAAPDAPSVSAPAPAIAATGPASGAPRPLSPKEAAAAPAETIEQASRPVNDPIGDLAAAVTGPEPAEETPPYPEAVVTAPEPTATAPAVPQTTVPWDGVPRVAIVIDDMGVARKRSDRALALPGRVTLSYLTYAEDIDAQVTAAKASRHSVMLHMPMEPESREVDPGPNVLLTGLPGDELVKAIRWNLDQFQGYGGVNNHMGSRFTRDATGMRLLARELKARGAYFLDSVTSNESVARKIAAAEGVPALARDVFLDHKDDAAFITRQLARLERLAVKNGHAIGIGHPRDATLTALETWIPEAMERGIEMVAVDDLIALAYPARAASAPPLR